jgi:SAM-dependent methyltransferase
MIEQQYDKLLNIHTEEFQKGFNDSTHYNRYEPTPYHALETLFHHYEIKSSDHVVDFGCGKGRLNFYLHYHFNATVTGIEMNESFYNKALLNQMDYKKKKKDKIHFHCCLAEEYQIATLDNIFYFFNPFSVPVFMRVINNILLSVEQFPRDVELILYYGSEEYLQFLEYQTAFELKEEIRIPCLYENNPYERFLIYRLNS